MNAQAPGILAEAARRSQAAFIHFSTDYVFDGQTDTPYTETAPTNPLGVYGKSKMSGEQAVATAGGAYLILRTAWVYSLRRASFVTKVLEWARKNPELRVVADQVSNPTWARGCWRESPCSAGSVLGGGRLPAGWESAAGFTTWPETATPAGCSGRKPSSRTIPTRKHRWPGKFCRPGRPISPPRRRDRCFQHWIVSYFMKHSNCNSPPGKQACGLPCKLSKTASSWNFR